MKKFCILRSCLMALVLSSPLVVWPQTVTMLVSTAAGSSSDMAARRLGQRAYSVLGETWVVSNVPGGNGERARSTFDERSARDTVLVVPDASVTESTLSGLTRAATLMTHSFALVGREGVRRPSGVAYYFAEGTAAKSLAESIARAMQATPVQYVTSSTALSDAKLQNHWVLIDGHVAHLAQREGLQVLAVGDKSLGLTDGNGQPFGDGAQSHRSFAELLGQPFPAARASISVYVKSDGGQELMAKLARLGMPPAIPSAAPSPSIVPRTQAPAADDPKARGRSARVQ